METAANEGGMGGPFRTRPFRRAASTPYDRPPAALRGVRGGRHVADGGGWISKLVDPASRLISRGASKLFSSMFRKRLTAPPTVSEEDHQSREDVSHIADTIPSSEIHCGKSPSEVQNDESPSQIQNNECPSEIQNDSRDGENRTNSSGSSGIAELEQLFEQKTFTRVEYDRLVGLLRSRTVEASNSEREINNERKEKASVSAQKDGIVSSRVNIPKDEAASPAELAKAYMGSQPLKTSSVGSQVFQEDANLLSIPSTSKRLDLSVAPRSVMRFSGIPEQAEHGYRTAKPPGRSAIYRMSRSAYFKAGDLSRDGYSSPSSSQWTPSSMKSGGKQVLKRGSTALDGDLGSFGPIRRIRQKSNLMSPSKGPHSTLSEHFLSSPSTPLFKNVSRGSTSIQRPLLVNDQKSDGTGLKTVENGISRPTMLPSQSSETAKKLFQQLDKLVPSPKEKSSEPKIIAQSESPSKLTLDVLHGSALSKMENLISSKSFTASHQPNTGSSLSQKLDMVIENGPLKSVCLGGKPSFEAHGVSKPSKDGQGGLTSESIAVAASVPKKPSFQMSAPEDSLELDDDYKRKKFNSPLTTGKDDADTKMSKQINVISETAISGNPIKTSSQSMPLSTSMPSSRRADKKALRPVVTEKNNGFAFPIVSDPCSQFQPPPTPTMPTPQLDRPDFPKEQTSPIFSFESKDANSSTISSTDVGVNGSVGIKVGEGSRLELKLSTSSAPTTCAEVSPLDKNEKENVGSLSKSPGNIVSSGLSALPKPSVFGFGTSSSANLNNSLLHSSSTTSPVSGTAAVTLSESLSSSIFVNSTAATSKSSSSFASSTAATSTINSFQIGSGGDISTSAPFSFSQLLDKSNSSTLGANSVKGSQFGISSSLSQGTSTVFASTGSSSSHVSSPISIFSSGGSSSALSTSAMSNSSFATSSLFSSTPGISSPIAVSSAFPSTISNAFGFNASTQSSSSGPSFANSSSQIPVATVFGATGGSTSSSPLFGNISSQISVTSTVSATEGSVFGTQSTQSPQSSISQFGSFSSSLSFGLGKSSSSSGFGISSLTPATYSSSGFSFSSGFGSSSANSSSSFAPAATPSLFSSSSQASTPTVFASTTNTSPSTGFSFGLSASASSASPFTFGSSSGSGFSFTSASTTTASNPSSVPTFGVVPNPATGFGSSSPGNDQMNEDSMTDDTTQAVTPLVPSFGQPTNPSPAQPFVFGSPTVQPGAPSPFQFGGQQSPLPQNPSPFQPTGSVEFNAGGSFSLGSGGGDKSGRRYVKVKREKRRK